jgi:signal transduction histidine kinase
VRYSKDGGIINISITNKSAIELQIENEAERIEAEDLKRVFDRFFRVPGSNVVGCGLGLAISKQIADLLGIKITHENKTGADVVIAKLIWP